MMRRGAGGKRRDANEVGIIAALRAVGATVEQLSAPDLPDLLVGFRGMNHLLEVKTEQGAKRKSKTAARQQAWAMAWDGDVKLVRNPDEALWAIGCPARRTG